MSGIKLSLCTGAVGTLPRGRNFTSSFERRDSIIPEGVLDQNAAVKESVLDSISKGKQKPLRCRPKGTRVHLHPAAELGDIVYRVLLLLLVQERWKSKWAMDQGAVKARRCVAGPESLPGGSIV